MADKPFSAKIYLKAGQVVELRNLASLKVTRNLAEDISSMEWEFNAKGNQKILYLDADEIAAVVTEK